MKSVTTKKDESFKVHNTWDLLNQWDEGGSEKYFAKLFDKLKTTLKEGTDLGRVKKSYTHLDEEALWFCFETKQNIVKVSLYTGNNINGGTWFTIADIKIVNN